MYKLITILLLLFFSLYCQAQQLTYLNIDIRPQQNLAKFDTRTGGFAIPASLTIGVQSAKGLSIEIGVMLNRMSSEFDAVRDRVFVYDFPDTYTLEGEIRHKGRITDYYIGVPLKLAFTHLSTSSIRLASYLTFSANFYDGYQRRDFYYYKTVDEFSLDARGKLFGIDKFVPSFNVGIQLEKVVYKRFIGVLGLDFNRLVQKMDFPLAKDEQPFLNVGALLGMKYILKEQER